MDSYFDVAVIGLRNPSFGDYSFGVIVARRLNELRIEPIDVMEVAEHQLSSCLRGYRTAIVACSFHGPQNGKVTEIELRRGEKWNETATGSRPKPLEELLRSLVKGARLPERIKVYSVIQSGFYDARSAGGADIGAEAGVAVGKILETFGMTRAKARGNDVRAFVAHERSRSERKDLQAGMKSQGAVFDRLDE